MIPLGCKIPNLALMKLSTWHKIKGDIVSLDEPEPDKVYVSSPFSKFKGLDYTHMFPDAEIEYGGYGFNDNHLPYEIEHMMPDYSIFNCDHSMGYTTRGCIRTCIKPPCIVPKMEGKTYRNSPIEEFHDPNHKTVELLDNNILSDEEWFFRNTDYLIENDLTLKEHGFDIRLVYPDIAERISQLNFEKQIHFALDTMIDIKPELMLLSRYGIKPYRLMFYLYEKDDFKDLQRRFEYILQYGCDPFVMPDQKASRQVKRFARFVNKRIYKVCSWNKYHA